MKAAPFEYVRAESIPDCTSALAFADGDAKVLAGGQSLTPVLAMRLARPKVVVDINRIPGLGALERRDDVLTLGALVRHAALVEQRHSPLLAEAGRWIGHPAIRSRGTIGGSLAHADPSAEWPVVASALDAQMTIVGPAGARTQGADKFFRGPLEPDLTADELLVAVDMPIPEAWGFAELSRRHGDFGLVIVVTARISDRWQVSVGGVGGVPMRAHEAEEILAIGTGPDSVRSAARSAAAVTTPSDDLHASGAYRRAMVEEFAFRSISDAVTTRTDGGSR